MGRVLALFPVSPVAIVTLLCAAIASVPSVRGATLIVTTTSDSGAGSLRDTIAAANDGDTIQFDAVLNGQTITLTSGELEIRKSVTVDGPGANQLTVQRSTANGTPAFRIFEVFGYPFNLFATIAGLTIANGNAIDAGGGISSAGRALTIVNCAVSGNSSSSYGGGIYSNSYSGGATMTIINSTISGNSASQGGGIYNVGPYYYASEGSVLTITNSTISGNLATSLGGGIANDGDLTIINSTISTNSAMVDKSGGGGGVYSDGNLTIANSTISANSASLGGGVKNVPTTAIIRPGILAMTNTTISGNSASEGGGMYVRSSQELRFRNSIIALNTSPDGPDVKVATGAFASEGFNLVGNNSGATISPAQPSDQIGTSTSPIDPLLGPLQNNGGTTFTHALLPGSPGIDKGESSGSSTDQRGFTRPVGITNVQGGDGSDIGAFEVQGAALRNFGNISTRLRVETGDNALIGGFILTGTQPRKVIVRAIGASLPVAGALADPILELSDGSGALIRSNDNWRTGGQEAAIIATGIPPTNNLESAIVETLPANGSAYTAIVRGVNNGTGVGLVEVYDLDQTVNSKLANISTRGLVQTGDDVMIGGFVLAHDSLRVIVRAIGPSLPVPGALGDPTLELHDGNGAVIAANDNWRADQEAEIIGTGLPPSNDLESAIVRDLAPGNYTAIVHGVNSTTGIALVEAYDLN